MNIRFNVFPYSFYSVLSCSYILLSSFQLRNISWSVIKNQDSNLNQEVKKVGEVIKRNPSNSRVITILTLIKFMGQGHRNRPDLGLESIFQTNTHCFVQGIKVVVRLPYQFDRKKNVNGFELFWAVLSWNLPKEIRTSQNFD